MGASILVVMEVAFADDKRKIMHLIQSYRQFFDIPDNIRDGIIFFRLMFIIVMSLVFGIQIGYFFF